MKKHLIAVAVAAAVATPAMAQVTVSGIIDSGYLSRKDQINLIDIKRNETGNANGASTSQLNFAATEDLGGGLRASAFHNVGLNSNTGGETARDTWVALAGGFGEFKTGRFTPAGETNAASYSVGSSTVNAAGTIDFMFGHAAQAATATGGAGPRVEYRDIGRGLNVANGGLFQYTSPRIAGGLTVTVGFADTKIDNTTAAMVGETQTQQKDLAINYSAGPFSMGLAIVDRRDNVEAVVAVEGVLPEPGVTGSAGANAVAASQTDRDLTSFGVSYNLGGVILRAGHIVREDKLTNANVNIIDATTTSIGLTIPMGANVFSVNVYDGDDGGDGAAANIRDLKGFQLFAVHNLSKRTNLYAVYGKSEYIGTTVATTSDRTDFAFGIRHSF